MNTKQAERLLTGDWIFFDGTIFEIADFGPLTVGFLSKDGVVGFEITTVPDVSVGTSTEGAKNWDFLFDAT